MTLIKVLRYICINTNFYEDFKILELFGKDEISAVIYYLLFIL